MSDKSESDLSGDNPTSLTLLDQVRQHNPQAWDRLVALYGPLIFHWCLRRGLSRSDAEDIRQEAFLRVSQGIIHFQKVRASDTFRGWLRVITQRLIIDSSRRRKRSPPVVEFESAPELFTLDSSSTLSVEELDEEQQVLYQRALDLLHQDFAETTIRAFMLTVVEDLAASDVATQLGITVNAVYIAKSRVLNRLRNDLSDP
jgi:RNA polymerase sigma-70 factor, ECF subfamily